MTNQEVAEHLAGIMLWGNCNDQKIDEALKMAIKRLDCQEVSAEDCISRKEALRIASITTASVNDVVNAINNLPSVSPLMRDYMAEAGAFELPQEEVNKLMDYLITEGVEE